METLGDKNQPKISHTQNCKFYCEYCDYNTSKKCNYDAHILSAKHKKAENGYKMGQKSANIQPKQEEIFVCSCGKEYQHRQGLWRHQKKCASLSSQTTDDKLDIYDLVKYLMKENSEMKHMMLEQQNVVLEIAKTTATNNIYNTTNSHNKAFNLNFFLNETCKDAMNIMDFVESIKLQVTDLERIGEVGYVEGISDIIVSNLNKLDVTQRPIHCTDKKRETMYVKDAGKWEKDENTDVIRRAIRKVTHNNQRLLPKFREKYPDYHNSYSSHSDKVTKVIIETMVNNVPDKEDKIIRNIAKSVVLDKIHSL